MGCVRKRTGDRRPRWPSRPTCLTECWSWGARSTSVSYNPEHGSGSVRPHPRSMQQGDSASDGTVNCGFNVMEMTMPQQYIDFAFVKANASFEAVLAHYNLSATGAGKDRAVLCPFHDEQKPSCKIELKRKIFHCFGCGTKGNVLEFVARIEGKPDDLRAAAFTLAGICKIPVASPRGQGRKDAPRRQEEQKASPAPQPTAEPEAA